MIPLKKVFSLLLLVFAGKYAQAQKLHSFLDGARYGYKNDSGTVVVAPQFETGADYHSGVAVLHDYNGNVWVIDTTGETLFKGFKNGGSASDYQPYFAEGLLAMYDDSLQRYGYINRQGEWILKPRFYEAHNFENGFAAVWENPNIYVDTLSGCGTPVLHPAWGYINKKGVYLIPALFSEPGIYTGDTLIFKLWDHTEVYNLKGERIQ